MMLMLMLMVMKYVLGNLRPLQEVRIQSGANVELDTNPSEVPGMKNVIIRGVATQIEAAVKLITQKTRAQVCVIVD